MIWDVKNPPTGYEIPCEIFDANGVELTVGVVWCDTDAGLVIHYKYDETGLVIDHEKGECVRVKSVYPAPLTISPKRKNIQENEKMRGSMNESAYQDTKPGSTATITRIEDDTIEIAAMLFVLDASEVAARLDAGRPDAEIWKEKHPITAVTNPVVYCSVADGEPAAYIPVVARGRSKSGTWFYIDNGGKMFPCEQFVLKEDFPPVTWENHPACGVIVGIAGMFGEAESFEIAKVSNDLKYVQTDKGMIVRVSAMPTLREMLLMVEQKFPTPPFGKIVRRHFAPGDITVGGGTFVTLGKGLDFGVDPAKPGSEKTVHSAWMKNPETRELTMTAKTVTPVPTDTTFPLWVYHPGDVRADGIIRMFARIDRQVGNRYIAHDGRMIDKAMVIPAPAFKLNETSGKTWFVRAKSTGRRLMVMGSNQNYWITTSGYALVKDEYEVVG